MREVICIYCIWIQCGSKHIHWEILIPTQSRRATQVEDEPSQLRSNFSHDLGSIIAMRETDRISAAVTSSASTNLIWSNLLSCLSMESSTTTKALGRQLHRYVNIGATWQRTNDRMECCRASAQPSFRKPSSSVGFRSSGLGVSGHP